MIREIAGRLEAAREPPSTASVLAAPRPAAPAGARDHRSGPAKGRGSQPAAAMFSRSRP